MMKRFLFTLGLVAVAVVSCKDDDYDATKDPTRFAYPLSDEQARIETLAGGELGTTFNSTASAYEDPTPAIERMGAENEFKYGEYFFERTITQDSKPFNGLGPLYIRSSCEDCHPGYGHGRRMTRYRADDWGNGYLLVVYDKRDDSYLTSLTGMPQTKAVMPFKAPLDERKIDIQWLEYTDDWGNTFPDGERYSLIYPEVSIPEDAYYVPLESHNQPVAHADVGVLLETTIGIYGTGLLDAIPDDSLKAVYVKEEAAGYRINPAIFANGEWVKQYKNVKQGDGEPHPLRFTYALTRGSIEDGPGANAIWNITNVTRSNRRYHYMTKAYATTASNDPEIQADFYKYFPEQNKSGDPKTDIYNYLMAGDLEVEMSDEDFVNLMIWHRGLAVPAARNLDNVTVQKGRSLFREMGCASCHKPSWKTGDDNYYDPNLFFKRGDSRLPRYPDQTIWPYTDMVQHRLEMKNNIRTGWCRTTPLWGRGLAPVCSGHADRLHDARARNTLEAIMWHGAKESDARFSIEKFRKLSKEDRDAVVKFIDAI